MWCENHPFCTQCSALPQARLSHSLVSASCPLAVGEKIIWIYSKTVALRAPKQDPFLALFGASASSSDSVVSYTGWRKKNVLNIHMRYSAKWSK